MDNIVCQFERQVNFNSDKVAVVFESNSWTYLELNNYANYIAYFLLSKDISESTVIAVSGTRSFEMIAAIIAVLKLKCTYMPIDLSLPISYVESMLANAEVRYVLSNGVYSHKTEGVTYIDLQYERFNNNDLYVDLNKSIGANDPAYIMHTSGSTGTPKGIIVPHRGVLRLVVNTNYINLSSSDSVLFHSNTTFDAAIFEIWAALLNGACIVISAYPTGDVLAEFKLCQEMKITVLLLATGLFHIFSDLDLEKLPYLRYLVVGGDVMHSASAIRAINKSKVFKIINGYGPAENTVFTTCLIIEKEKDITNPVSIGKPIYGTKVYLLDKNLREVKKGEVGEIYVTGEGVSLGYVNAPHLTQEKFFKINHVAGNEIVYRTGDMAKILPSGNFEFVGRYDNQVKIRGFRIELTEIENTISSFDFVEDVCVVKDINKKIIAYIKIAQSYGDDLEHLKVRVISFLKQKLPSYYLPSYIEISKELPLTRNGKVDRKLLQSGFFIKSDPTQNRQL
jgi:amino acid adenylation domain-containing protein